MFTHLIFNNSSAGTAPRGVVELEILKKGRLNCFITEVAQQEEVHSVASVFDLLFIFLNEVQAPATETA